MDLVHHYYGCHCHCHCRYHLDYYQLNFDDLMIPTLVFSIPLTSWMHIISIRSSIKQLKTGKQEEEEEEESGYYKNS